MVSAYHSGLDPLVEQRVLLTELDHVRSDWALTAATIEAILGVGGEELRATRRTTLPGNAEAQLRRMLEVARLAKALIGPGARDWLLAAEAQLGFATPVETMVRPGGLAYVRDLLRDAWEDVTDMGRTGGRLS